MKPFIVTLAAAFSLLIAASSYAQSLGDLAKKEKERRLQVKSEPKVITNREASKYHLGAVTTGSRLTPPAKQDSEKPTLAKPEGSMAGPVSDEPTDFQGRPESWWRQTLSDARKNVKDLENEGNVLTLRQADLQNQFYRESSGFKQQDIQREIQKTFYEQDLNKEKLAKAKKELEDLEKEARRSGALTGWLNPKTP